MELPPAERFLELSLLLWLCWLLRSFLKPPELWLCPPLCLRKPSVLRLYPPPPPLLLWLPIVFFFFKQKKMDLFHSSIIITNYKWKYSREKTNHFTIASVVIATSLIATVAAIEASIVALTSWTLVPLAPVVSVASPVVVVVCVWPFAPPLVWLWLVVVEVGRTFACSIVVPILFHLAENFIIQKWEIYKLNLYKLNVFNIFRIF